MQGALRSSMVATVFPISLDVSCCILWDAGISCFLLWDTQISRHSL